MGLFNFFRKNQPGNLKSDLPAESVKDIPRSLFIDEQDPLENIDLPVTDNNHKGIAEIYNFLQHDYESRGYNDALTNPDESCRNDNLNLIRHDLAILVMKVITYYEDMLKDIDFHISSRGRAGLVDLVDILRTRKTGVEEHLTKVSQIKNDLDNNTGIAQRIILSYQRGFMKGLSAITITDVLKKEF